MLQWWLARLRCLPLAAFHSCFPPTSQLVSEPLAPGGYDLPLCSRGGDGDSADCHGSVCVTAVPGGTACHDLCRWRYTPVRTGGLPAAWRADSSPDARTTSGRESWRSECVFARCLFHPRSFTWKLGPLQRTVSATNLASGLLLLLMAGTMIWVGVTFGSMQTLTGWQATSLSVYSTPAE